MKAYKLKPQQARTARRICPYCEEPAEFTQVTLYRHRNYDHVFEDDGYTYFDTDCVSREVWSCESCGSKTEDEPDLESEDVWVCGNCNEEHDDEEDAQECCL